MRFIIKLSGATTS